MAPASHSPHSTPMPMVVKVRTVDGVSHQYDGLFRHTFDGFDDALQRFGTRTARIEVTVVQPDLRAAA